MSGGALKVFVALHIVDYASRHLMHFSNLAANAGKNVGALNKQLTLMGGLAGVMAGGAIVGGMIKLADSSIKAAMAIEQVKLKLHGLGLTTSQISRVTDQVNRLSQIHPAITQASGLNMFKDTYSVLGNYKESQQMMPYMAKFMMSMRGLYGERGDEMGWDAVRASELQMGKNFNPKGMMSFLDSYNKVAYASGGKIDPAQIHAFMKNTPFARMSQTPDAIAKQMMLMMEMGGGRAGTGLQAIDRFAIGHITQNGVSKERLEKWADYGLIENIKRNKKGKITDFNLIHQDEYMKDKIGWLYGRFAPALQKQGIDPYSPSGIPKIAQMFSTQTGAGAAISTMLQKQRNIKEGRLYNAAPNVSQGAAMYEKSPMGAFAGFMGALHNLQQAIGTALMPLFIKMANGLTPIIQGITRFVQLHPRITQIIFLLITFGGVLLTLGGAVAIVVGMFGTIAGVVAGGIALVIAGVMALMTEVAGIISNRSHIVAAWQAVCSAVAGIVYRLVGVVQQAASMIPGMASMKYAAMNSFQKGDASAPIGGFRGHGAGSSWGAPARVPSMGGPKGGVGGHVLSQNIHIDIHESKDAKHTGNQVAMAIRGLINTKSDSTTLTTPNLMHGYA